MYRRLLCAAAISTALVSAGCADEVNPTPIDPTPTEITEPPFTGTLALRGGVTTSFQSIQAGTVTAIVDSLEPLPPTGIGIGVSLGVWNGTSCQQITFNDNASVGSGVAGLANGAGNLCARVYDSGNLTEPVAFVLTIKHH
jgi:hypothetical protein